MAIHRAWKRPWNKALRRVASSLGLVCCQVAETCLTFFQSRKSPCQCVGALAKTFTNRAELTVCSWRRRRQPSQSSLRYQQKKALNVLIRPIYRHDRIGKCGISGVAMMGAGPLLLFFIATQKYVENGHRFSRGRRNRFLHH